jgi:hypothetical protein
MGVPCFRKEKSTYRVEFDRLNDDTITVIFSTVAETVNATISSPQKHLDQNTLLSKLSNINRTLQCLRGGVELI